MRCDDLDLAAAFGTIGVPMKTSVQVRADNGKEYVTVFLRPESVTQPNIKTAHLMRLISTGELLKADPEHPLLYALQGIRNRNALGQSINGGTERVVLITRKGTQRTAYVKESASSKQLAIADRFLAGHTP